MNLLLNVFVEPKSVMRNATSRWRVRPFTVSVANYSMYSAADGDELTDSLFLNMDAHLEFDTFL